MALKDLLVYLDNTDGSQLRVRLAADLARRHNSRITALYIREWNPTQLARQQTAEMAGRSIGDLHALERGVEASIDSQSQRLRSELERLAAVHALTIEWCSVTGEPMQVLPQYARYADLCMLGVDTPAGSTAAGYRFSEEMLFIAGRPMLFIPSEGQFQSVGNHIVVAWNSSRASARSVSDALPLLERAAQITVLAINPADFIGRHGARPLPQLIEHLHHHGVQATTIQIDDVAPEHIAGELQSRARNIGADLIVAGAYGHSRLREILLGGVTRDLLAHMTLPIMMSN